MAFMHSKNAKLLVDQYDLSSYFNDFTFAAKAQAAETTCYGRGAKGYIPGLIEGTIQAKGFYDAGTTAIDQELANALGRANDMCLSMTPSGSWTPGTRVIAAGSVLTDYSISAPVANVVSVSMAATADGGLKTGIALHDPAVAETTIGTIPGQTGNAGSITGVQDYPAQGTTSSGAYAVLHVMTLAGTGTPLITAAKVQTSTTSGGTFVDLLTFNAANISTPGSYFLGVVQNVSVNSWVRCSITTSGSTISTTYLISFVRL